MLICIFESMFGRCGVFFFSSLLSANVFSLATELVVVGP